MRELLTSKELSEPLPHALNQRYKIYWGSGRPGSSGDCPRFFLPGFFFLDELSGVWGAVVGGGVLGAAALVATSMVVADADRARLLFDFFVSFVVGSSCRASPSSSASLYFSTVYIMC